MYFSVINSGKRKNFNCGFQSYGIMIHTSVKARLIIDCRFAMDSYEVTDSSPFVSIY